MIPVYKFHELWELFQSVLTTERQQIWLELWAPCAKQGLKIDLTYLELAKKKHRLISSSKRVKHKSVRYDDRPSAILLPLRLPEYASC